MNRTLQPAVSFFAVGLLGLGVLALVYHDFALVCGSQSRRGCGPHRSGLRLGVLMLGLRRRLLFRATALWSVRILFPTSSSGCFSRLRPVRRSCMEAVWLGFGRSGHAHDRRLDLVGCRRKRCAAIHPCPDRGQQRAPARDGGLRPCPIAYWPLHLVYIPETVGLYPRGCPLILSGRASQAQDRSPAASGILFRVFPRLAAWCEAGMVTLFTLLVWLPIRRLQPGDRGPGTDSSSPGPSVRCLGCGATAGGTSARTTSASQRVREDSSINSARIARLHWPKSLSSK